MTEQLFTNLLLIIIVLVLCVIWAGMIAYVYQDAKKRNITGLSRLLWVLVSAIVPLVGLFAYLMAHTMSLPSIDLPQPATSPKAQAKRRTRPMQSGKAVKKKTRTPQQYRQKYIAPDNQNSADKQRQTATPDSTAQKRITKPPHATAKKRKTKPPSVAVRLTVTSGPGMIHNSAELSSGETLIGAAPEGDADRRITIDGDDSLSSTQARISMIGQEFHLENLSQYGTEINGKRLSSVGQTEKLPLGCQIRMGNTYLELTGQSQKKVRRTKPPRSRVTGKPKNNSRMAYVLTAEEGPYLGQQFVITSLPATIGRLKSCAIRLDKDGAVSRKHAEFYLQGQALRLRDLESQRGISVNGHDIEDKVLEQGDKIRVGHSVLIFQGQRRGR